MNNYTPFDEILLYSNNDSKKIELCKWLNNNYTFCLDNFELFNIDSFFNTKSKYYNILLKNPNPYKNIKYISFVLFEDYKGSKFIIQY